MPNKDYCLSSCVRLFLTKVIYIFRAMHFPCIFRTKKICLAIHLPNKLSLFGNLFAEQIVFVHKMHDK